MKITLSLVLIFLISVNSFSQDKQVNDVKTPLNNTVNSWQMLESGSTVRAALDYEYSRTRPNAVQIYTYDGYSSSRRFNCHGYAWYMSQKSPELTNPRWIGYYPGNTDEYIYWNDGSYIEVANETYPGMISWTAKDHSAITTSVSGKWKSKWNEFPLFVHDWDDTPYGTTNLKFYSPFKINNPSYVCFGNTATFSTPDYINCAFNWTYDTNLLNIVSGQNTKTFVVEPKTPDSKGQAWVKLELTIGSPINITRSVIKNIWVGTPDFPVLSLVPPSYVSIGSHHSVSVESPGADPALTTWSTSGCVTLVNVSGNYASFMSCPIDGCGSVYVSSANLCGCTNNSVLFVVSGNGGDCLLPESAKNFSLVIFPNPATGETTLTIEPGSGEKSLSETAEWELEIYTQTQLLKEKKTRLKGRSVKIQTAGWQEGVYLARAIYNGQVVTGKLVVKR